MGNDKVAYFYDSDVGFVHYGARHPMKPIRLDMTHHLIMGYELHKCLEVYRPRRAYPAELCQFHSPEYIDFLANVTPDNRDTMREEAYQFNMGDDCPVFDGLYDFCSLYAGASVAAAQKLNHGLCNIAINWSGGLHHAKKGEASGFCFVNDLVLAILELLKFHARVLYVDIDIHHGDGVEEAFYLTDRVMTVSFHMYGNYFFPGTGALEDVGERGGRFCSLNVPLVAGTDNGTFLRMFKRIMRRVMEVYQPECVVLQCGADSLAGDRLGCFNLSIEGHAEAVRFMKSFNVPMLVTGGGGYTKENVARCWTYETSCLVGREIPEELPPNLYYDYYAPGHTLNRSWCRETSNLNMRNRLEDMCAEIMDNLSHLAHAPGVQLKERPPERLIPQWQPPHEEDADARLTQYARDHLIVRDNEFSDEIGAALG